METVQLLAKVEAKISQLEKKLDKLRRAYNTHHHDVQDLGPAKEDIVVE